MTGILIVTAVEAEREAIERGLPASVRAAGDVVVTAGGVGAAAVAAATAAELARRPFSHVVSVGIGGGFTGAAKIGDLLAADRIIAADLGAQTGDGFLSLDDLGFGTCVYEAFRVPGEVFVRGDLLTVNTATGTAERADLLRARHPAAVGEAMEGYGVAVAAARFGVPVAEIRAVSNPVGPRDRTAWRIGEALAALTEAAGLIVEGLS
ncbi:MAG TPA: futalosine hydrolase [Actinocrinis sp.]|jgi:futalosine hydrolase|uniref:futalosine hydrolase n=1 Tax=Actinocrinis sp. TaxID=1920516 RepID=UPI002DDCC0FF|nr:futalosine hydrolase [Actinocrinis sp.]HEV3169681.1 futalosine hydrolase [Actinocrinis sp.]